MLFFFLFEFTPLQMSILLACLRFCNIMVLQGYNNALFLTSTFKCLTSCPLERKAWQSEGHQVLPTIWHRGPGGNSVSVGAALAWAELQSCMSTKRSRIVAVRSSVLHNLRLNFLWLMPSLYWSNQYASLGGEEGQFSLQHKDLGMNNDKFRLIDPIETSTFL